MKVILSLFPLWDTEGLSNCPTSQLVVVTLRFETRQTIPKFSHSEKMVKNHPESENLDGVAGRQWWTSLDQCPLSDRWGNWGLDTLAALPLQHVTKDFSPLVVSDRKCKPNFFQQEENVLALKTKHWGLMLVSSMAGFWTQFNDTQFVWCLSTIFSCDRFLLRLLVARGLRHLQPHPPGRTQRKRARRFQGSPETHSDWVSFSHVLTPDGSLLPGSSGLGPTPDSQSLWFKLGREYFPNKNGGGGGWGRWECPVPKIKW